MYDAPVRDYEIVTREHELGRIANLVIAAQFLGLDIETYKRSPNQPTAAVFDPRHAEIRLVQLNIDDMYIIVIDLMRTGGLGPVEDAIRKTKAVFIIHNAKFE